MTPVPSLQLRSSRCLSNSSKANHGSHMCPGVGGAVVLALGTLLFHDGAALFSGHEGTSLTLIVPYALDCGALCGRGRPDFAVAAARAVVAEVLAHVPLERARRAKIALDKANNRGVLAFGAILHPNERQTRWSGYSRSGARGGAFERRAHLGSSRAQTGKLTERRGNAQARREITILAGLARLDGRPQGAEHFRVAENAA